MGSEPQTRKERSSFALTGTTLRVYRYIFTRSEAPGIHDVQRGLELSSASVAEYHIKKLLDNGLIRESDGGYVADKAVFENIVKFGRWVFPFQWTYSVFFATCLVLLLTIMKPAAVNTVYLFAVVIDLAALSFSAYEGVRVAKLIFRR
jgi:hypothetical protein